GVANSIKQIPGSIGYIELAYADQNKIPYAQLRNKAGKFLEPSLESAAKAADIKDLPDNMEFMITDSSNPDAYPISGFTWLLIYANQANAAKGDAVAQLAWWMIHQGQKYAHPLGYAPLQGVAVKKAENLLKQIKADNKMVLQ